MNWRTAKRLLSLPEQEYLNEQEKVSGRKKSLEAYEEFVKAKFIMYPDTAAQMHDWLKEKHAHFSVVNQKTAFNFVFSVRGKYNIPKIEVVRDYVCVPELPYGLQAQVDGITVNGVNIWGSSVTPRFYD